MKETYDMHIEAFKCYRPQPGDVLIVKPDSGKTMSPKYAGALKDLIRLHLPSFVKVLVLNECVDIEVIRTGEDQCEAAN